MNDAQTTLTNESTMTDNKSNVAETPEEDPRESTGEGGTTSPSDDSGDREHEGDPVVAKLTGELKARYPDWRLTTHYTPEGRKVTMVEFADQDGEFTEGLSGEFVSMVSQSYGNSQDTEQ